MRIELNRLHHTYPSGDEALKGVSMVIEGTQPVAIIGQNGSGKTTLVKHFNGILRPTQGELLLDGRSIATRSTAQWARDVGYVFQNPDDQLFLDTVRKELEFGCRRIGMTAEPIAERMEPIVEICGLRDLLDIHPFDLSATEKKFCTIASILMMNPRVIIFDEPTCGQDLEGMQRLCSIIDFLRAEEKLVITISHDMKFVVANFERTIVMYGGTVLLDGSTEKVFAQPEVIARSFVYPPPITRVAQSAGIERTVFTVEALVESIESMRKKRKRGVPNGSGNSPNLRN